MNATAHPLLKAFDVVVPASMRAQPARLLGARHLSLLAAVTALSVPLLVLMYHLIGCDAVAVAVTVAGAAMVASPLLLGTRFGLAGARDVFVGALFVLKVWMGVHLGGIAAPTTSWFVLCPAVALLVGGLRPGLAWGALVLAAVVALFVGGRMGALPPSMADAAATSIMQLASAVGLLVLITLIVALAIDKAAVRER